MKIKFIALALIYSAITYAQEDTSFFIEITDPNYILTITHDYDNNKLGTFNSKNQKLNQLISNYKIYDVQLAYKNSRKKSLQNIYLIYVDDIKLMHDLQDSFSSIYSKLYENKVELLSLPNDFGTTGGYIEIQEELNYIRAPEAWDLSTGSTNIIIGISDNSVALNHEDLYGTTNHVFGNNYPNSTSSNTQHGSQVSSVAAANTNNNLGMSAIGYNTSIYNATHNWVPGVHALAQMSGVKVINTAWVSSNSSSNQDVFNEVVEHFGVPVVASAGNSSNGGSANYVYPASFKNVISVSAIGHEDNTWTHNVWGHTTTTSVDHHEMIFNGVPRAYQHNDSVDIVAPGYGILLALPNHYGGGGILNNYTRTWGTSSSSPMVSGTIALMFDKNYCIDPKEVETILKLTAVKIDTLPQNLPYYGRLGAGKLDAYEAVKMAKDMADQFGTVEVKDRILYRPWFYKLVTAPYEIKMSNNDVSKGAKLKFRARNNIEILSGEYLPDTGGYVDLQIDANLDLNHCPPPPAQARQGIKKDQVSNLPSKIKLYPTLVINDLNIERKSKQSISETISISIFDFFGVKVFTTDNLDSEQSTIKLNNLKSGIYIVKIFNDIGEIIHTEKIMKK